MEAGLMKRNMVANLQENSSMICHLLRSCLHVTILNYSITFLPPSALFLGIGLR